MAEYEMQELTLPSSDGKRILYPRMVVKQQVDLEHIAENIQRASSYGKGEIVGLVQELVYQMAMEMAGGKSVKIDGIGVFTPSLALRANKPRETGAANETRRNATSICLRTINFRADKQLIHETARYCTLERSKYKFRRSSRKYSPEKRLELAQDYLRQHPYMNVADYCRLTGLLRDTAAKELRRWASQPETGIATTGRSTHKVYILKES